MKWFSIIRRLSLLPVLPATLLLAPGLAHAQVSCTSNASGITFNPISGLATGTTNTGTINWSCTNNSLFNIAYVTMCLNIGSGTGGTSGTTRLMSGGTPPLQFQLYTGAGSAPIWGSVLSGPNPTPVIEQFTITSYFGGSSTGSATVYGTIPAGQSTISPGNYSSSFNGTDAVITMSYNSASIFGGGSYPSSCGTTQSGSFPFTVSATVIKQCTVSAGAASNINLGSVPSTATNITGNNSISVSCTSTTPYYIGLSPNSTGSTTGAGKMSGTGGNTDKVPYQLHSVSAAGPIWGNTANSTSVGNGVAGTGTGSAQAIPVYAKAPSANYKPDSYSDTVTVNVNY